MNFTAIEQARALALQNGDSYIAELLGQQENLIQGGDVQSAAVKLRLILENVCKQIIQVTTDEVSYPLSDYIDYIRENGIIDENEAHTFHVIRNYGNTVGAHASGSSSSMTMCAALTEELCAILLNHNGFINTRYTFTPQPQTRTAGDKMSEAMTVGVLSGMGMSGLYTNTNLNELSPGLRFVSVLVLFVGMIAVFANFALGIFWLPCVNVGNDTANVIIAAIIKILMPFVPLLVGMYASAIAENNQTDTYDFPTSWSSLQVTVLPIAGIIFCTFFIKSYIYYVLIAILCGLTIALAYFVKYIRFDKKSENGDITR